MRKLLIMIINDYWPIDYHLLLQLMYGKFKKKGGNHVFF